MHFEHILNKFTLPLTDPVLVFSTLLFIILLAPVALRRFKIPSIVGLIIAGAVFGPHGIHLLDRGDSVILFGTVGILYIMFLAGLEINIKDIRRTGAQSLLYGILVFGISLTGGTIYGLRVMDMNLAHALMLGSMLSTYTLLAYPIASRLGVTASKAVGIAVGGIVVTDTLALLMLTVIVAHAKGAIDYIFFLQLALGFALFIWFTLIVIPKLSGWFFNLLKGESTLQYIFVLAIVFVCGFFAELAGIEPIIGAFLAGISLNRLIPHNSNLMGRIEFVGNAIFIPFFLIGTGMLVNYSVFFKSPEVIITALLLSLLALGLKYFSAFIVKIFFRLTNNELNVLFGLSAAKAAATLAIVTIGFNMGMFSEMVMNATVGIIFITCLVSSFITEVAGRNLAIEMRPDIDLSSTSKQRILVPLANPLNAQPLIDLAIALRHRNTTDPVYPLTIVKDDDDAEENIEYNNEILAEVKTTAAKMNVPVQIASRVNINPVHGIESAIKELMITEILIGWGAKSSAAEFIFGNILQSILLKTEKMVITSKILQPLSEVKKIVVVCPEYAELEKGYLRWLGAILRLAETTGARMQIIGFPETINETINVLHKLKTAIRPEVKITNEDFNVRSEEIHFGTGELWVIISARQRTISYQSYMESLPEDLNKKAVETGFLLVYPEQHDIRHYESMLQFDGLSTSPIQDNLERINKLRKILSKSILGKDESKE